MGKLPAMTQIQTQNPHGRLGEKGLVSLIIFLSAFVPLSTDIYLPALPGMAREFHTTAGIANLTLALFFVFYAGSALVWGPLSDRWGRRKTLQSGLWVYLAGSLACAVAQSIGALILARVLQAIGAGCTAAVAVAIIKDTFPDRRRRETIMAISMSAAMIAPIVAPILGAFLLKIMNWRALFGFLACMGFLAQIGVALFKDNSIPDRSASGVLSSLKRLGTVLANPRFSLLLLTFSLVAVSSIGYVSAASYIYIDEFGLSQQGFSYFFAMNALFIVLGPLLYVKLSRVIAPRTLVLVSFGVPILCGLAMYAWGAQNPWAFALTLVPSTLAGSLLRPFATNLMLEQQQGDTGSASALINSTYLIFGTLGMVLLSQGWESRVRALGVVMAIMASLALLSWSLYGAKAAPSGRDDDDDQETSALGAEA